MTSLQDKLIKCLTEQEIYFIKIYLLDKKNTFEINVSKASREYKITPQYIRNVLRILELVGVIKTLDAGKSKIVNIEKRDILIKLANTI